MKREITRMLLRDYLCKHFRRRYRFRHGLQLVLKHSDNLEDYLPVVLLSIKELQFVHTYKQPSSSGASHALKAELADAISRDLRMM